jgi:hypothetical protein
MSPEFFNWGEWEIGQAPWIFGNSQESLNLVTGKYETYWHSLRGKTDSARLPSTSAVCPDEVGVVTA